MKNLPAIIIVLLTSFSIHAQYPACDTVPLELVTSEVSFSSSQFSADSTIYIPIINKISNGFAYPIAKIELSTSLPAGMTCINCDWNVFGSSWSQNDTLVIDMDFNVTIPIPDNYTVSFNVIIMNLMGGGNLNYDTCQFQNSVTVNLKPVVLSAINEISTKPKELLFITDMLGRRTTPAPNKILLYIYDNGTVEKKIQLIR